MQFHYKLCCMPKHLFRRGMERAQQRPVCEFSNKQFHSMFNTSMYQSLYSSANLSVYGSLKPIPRAMLPSSAKGISSGNIYKKSLGENISQNTSEEKDHFPSDKGMNTRLSAENDYLSWMRNSYIMTLGGVSMLHFDLWSAGPVAGAAALLTASLNLLWGTMGYLHNLQCLHRRNYISGVMCRLAQLWALLHFTLWVMVLMVIFPDYKLIEASAQKFEDEEEER